MRFSLLVLCVFSSLAQAAWHEPFKAGDRVFDSRNYQAGTVVNNLANGNVEVKLDNKSKIRSYSSYYAAELGPKVESCNEDSFCVGDNFLYTLPIIGQNRKAEVIEIFQGSDGYTDTNKYGKIIYGVKFEDESAVLFLNSGHLGWMIPTNN